MWIQVYALEVKATGGDHNTMVAYVLIMLITQAMRWLQNPPHDAIDLWDDFCRRSIANFLSTYDQLRNKV
jgi:hypothetical protein